jgi:hypothetical protein
VKRLVLLGLGLALATGCSSRYLVSIEDGPTDNGPRTTVLTTIDVKSYVVVATAKYVFWECQEQGDGLVCEKRCDTKDDQGDLVACQQFQALPF